MSFASKPPFRSVITLSVDDCWRDHAIAFYRMFESYGLKGVFYVIPGLTGKQFKGTSFIDWATLREMAVRGHEIGSHSMTHRAVEASVFQKMFRLVNEFSNEEAKKTIVHLMYYLGQRNKEYTVKHLSAYEELMFSKVMIEEHIRMPCKSYSYPGGGFSEDLKGMVRSVGYSSARTGYSGYNIWSNLDPYELRVKTWDKDTKSSVANSWVDEAIEKRFWLIEVFHLLDAPDYLLSCPRKELVRHLSYVQSKRHEIECMTVGEIF